MATRHLNGFRITVEVVNGNTYSSDGAWRWSHWQDLGSSAPVCSPVPCPSSKPLQWEEQRKYSVIGPQRWHFYDLGCHPRSENVVTLRCVFSHSLLKPKAW